MNKVIFRVTVEVENKGNKVHDTQSFDWDADISGNGDEVVRRTSELAKSCLAKATIKTLHNLV